MKFFIFFLSLFFSLSSYALDNDCKTNVFKEIPHLTKMVESYPFRIWYADSGIHALEASADNRISSKPENIINDLLLQLHSADKYFSENLGLEPPLSSERFGQAKFIDVYLLSMKAGMGIAFDEPIIEKATKNSEPLDCGIKFHLNKKIKPSYNLTPAHELFHLYQYANSMFKTRWYLEGMANWIGEPFLGLVSKNINTAVEDVSCGDVYAESYSAIRYWRYLAKRKKSADVLAGEELLNIFYSDGRPVFKVNTFKHGSIIKDIFEKLKEVSVQSSNDMNMSLYKWPEKLQRSNVFDSSICNAVESI